eukprot:COSAG06_NODE_58810_length_276_cov_0.581921_1_plen_46_part_10
MIVLSLSCPEHASQRHRARVRRLVGIHTVAAAEAITFAAKCGVSPT